MIRAEKGIDPKADDYRPFLRDCVDDVIDNALHAG